MAKIVYIKENVVYRQTEYFIKKKKQKKTNSDQLHLNRASQWSRSKGYGMWEGKLFGKLRGVYLEDNSESTEQILVVLVC